MKTFFYIVTVCLTLITFHCPGIEARQFRNIFTITAIDYDNIGKSTVYENTFLTELRQGLSFLLKGYHDKRNTWNNSIITLGPVININRYHYIELTYGHGRDSDKKKANYYAVELTREKPKYLFGLGFKHSAYPGYFYNTLSPSIKYYLTPKFALWGKYFASIDSKSNFGHAYWTYAEHDVTSRGEVRFGFISGNRLYSPEYESFFGGRVDMSFFSIMAQCSFNLSSRITLKYQYENMSRQSKYTDIKNTLVLDVRF